MYHLHSDTAECLGGLASGTLVDHFSVLRGGPEPVEPSEMVVQILVLIHAGVRRGAHGLSE